MDRSQWHLLLYVCIPLPHSNTDITHTDTHTDTKAQRQEASSYLGAFLSMSAFSARALLFCLASNTINPYTSVIMPHSLYADNALNIIIKKRIGCGIKCNKHFPIGRHSKSKALSACGQQHFSVWPHSPHIPHTPPAPLTLPSHSPHTPHKIPLHTPYTPHTPHTTLRLSQHTPLTLSSHTPLTLSPHTILSHSLHAIHTHPSHLPHTPHTQSPHSPCCKSQERQNLTHNNLQGQIWIRLHCSVWQ